MADDVGLPKSVLQKAVKEGLPADMRMAGDAGDLLVHCCNQFVHLLSTQANDVSEREKRSTISPEHVVRALQELEFGPQYVDAVRAVWEEWKVENKEHHSKAGARKQGSGLTQEQLLELQHKLFEEARAATLSGPLPSMVVADAAAAVVAVPAAQQQQAQQQQAQQPAAADTAQPAEAPPVTAASGAAAAGEQQEGQEEGDDLSDEEYSGSSQVV